MAVSVARRASPAGLFTLLTAYAGFVLLGLPDGMLGVAWPSIYHTFELPVESFGLLLGAGTAGYLLTSSGSGRLVARLGIGTVLLVGSGLRGLGLLGLAVAPAWWVLVLFNFCSGLGAGSIDAGFNTYVAAHYSAGRMSWLHACFGLGATIGPLLMTASLTQAGNWRPAYLIVAALQGVVVLTLALTLRRWHLRAQRGGQDEPEVHSASAAQTLRLPIVWLGVATFFVYTGVEFTAGQWPYTLFTEARAVPEAVAGAWVSLYWGSLTVGRILGGFVADRIGPTRLLRLSVIGAVVGAALVLARSQAAFSVAGLAVHVGHALNFIGLALTGFSLATIFPTLISLTPGRVGLPHAANAIGFQIGAAGLGAAALPGLAGLLAGRLGLEAIGPFLLAATVVQWVLFEAGERRAALRRAVRGQPLP